MNLLDSPLLLAAKMRIKRKNGGVEYYEYLIKYLLNIYKIDNMQHLTLIGNIGNEPAIRTPRNGGDQFLSFTIAVNETYKNADDTKVEKTTWYDCVYKRTTIAPHIKKGDQIYVSGTPSFSIYQDKEGKNLISISVSVSSVQLLNNKRD